MAVLKYLLNSSQGVFSHELLWGAAATAAVGAASSLIGSVAGITANGSLNGRNRRWQEKMATIQYERQKELQQMQNDWYAKYNSPSNQRAMFEAAGINPNAMVSNGSFGNVGGSSGSAGSAPSAGSPQSIPYDFSAIASLGQQFAQIQLMESEAKKNNADAGLTEQQTTGQSLQNTFQSIQNKISEQYAGQQAAAELNKTDSEAALNDAQRLLSRTQWSLNMDELSNIRPKEASKIVAETLASEASTALDKALTAKTDKERDLLMRQFALQLSVANATIANQYAQAYHSRVLGNSYAPGGIMHAAQRISNMHSSLEYESYERFYDTVTDSMLDALKAQYDAASQRQGFRVEKEWNSLENIFHNIKARYYYQNIDELGSILGGSGAAAVNQLGNSRPAVQRLIPFK